MASCWAHPRACGENGKTFTVAVLVVGSSPRVRGKRTGDHDLDPGTRLIPACAGKTVRRWASGTATRAHPRVCGENIPGAGIPPGLVGSSPRVRGKLGAIRPAAR